MRVTDSMGTDFISQSLFRQSQSMLKLQKQIVTEKRILKPSDDPIGAGKAVDLNRTLRSLSQYRRNIEAGMFRLEYQETVLGQIHERVKEALNTAFDESASGLKSRLLSADRIALLREELQGLANSQFAGDYLFAGHQIDTTPFANRVEITGAAADPLVFGLAADATEAVVEIRNAAGTVVRSLTLGDGATAGSGGSAGINTVAWNGLDDGGNPLPDGTYAYAVTATDGSAPVADYVSYNGDRGEIRLMHADGLGIDINVDGVEAFSDLFAQLAILEQGLRNSDIAAGTAQIGATLHSLTAVSEGIQKVRAEGAVQHQRLKSRDDQLQTLKLRLEDGLEQVQGVDLARTIVELQNLQKTYETTLATAARLVQPSLLQFLR
jgi:flagellar hook-associated protein 3 FlgL